VLLLAFLLAGSLAMLPVTRMAVYLWSSDPLRSFGALLPLASIAIAVRNWKRLGWSFAPTPWGLLAIAVAIVAARAVDGMTLSYRMGWFGIDPLQPGMIVAVYFSGILLLTGGFRLWRASLFAVALMFCVNPVPHFFNVLVDFPLQRISAQVARSFAHVLGLYPTGEQLQLMFTPKFGMQIIPGCNGMRGAATMAYVALLVSYLRGYRPLRIAGIVCTAALLGYLLNFVRLCLLVVYYAIGQNHPHLRGDGELIDYIIGGCLFLIVGTLAGALWLGGDKQNAESLANERPIDWPALLRRPLLATVACLLGLTALPELPSAYALARSPSSASAPATVFTAMPVHAGSWQRSNSYTTEITEDTPHWVWATYTHADGRKVDLGIWLLPFQHVALRSRQIRGVNASWEGGMQATATGDIPVQFSSYVSQDDLGSASLQAFYAETICLPRHCSSYATGFGKTGWSIAVGPTALRSGLRLPLQLRVRQPDNTPISAEQRAQDERAIRDLIAHVNTRALTERFGFR